MKRMKNKAFLLIMAALALSLLICGCMDRRENAPAGASGTEADAGTNGQGTDAADGKGGTDEIKNSETDGATDAETEMETKPKTDIDVPGKYDASDVSTEIRKAIADAYTQKYPQSGGVASMAYYGEYEGAVAVMIYGNNLSYTQALWSEKVDGVTFNYKDGNYIVVFDGSGLLRLSEAFENGLLTHDDLEAISSLIPGYKDQTVER